MRIEQNFNQDWYYTPNFDENYLVNNLTTGWQNIELPHTNKMLPYNYFNEQDYQFISSYRKSFFVPKSWKGLRVILSFEAVMAYAEVFCNGIPVTSHKGGYTAFNADLTDYLYCDKQNTILVKVDSTERADFPPCGNTVDYLTYGGIYREVALHVVEQMHITSLKVSPRTNNDTEFSEVSIQLSKADTNAGYLSLTLQQKGTGEVIATRNIDLAPGVTQITDGFHDVPLIHWSPETPILYEVTAKWYRSGDILQDCVTAVFGQRFCEFRPDGFYLNGEKRKLIGLNRHQSYPYVGNAMPSRVQKKDADILKYELGVNLVRTSHYPQSRHFLDRCDEIGLMVFEEIPGWQHVGDEEWQETSVKNVEEMITHDYNHPSIILWGVRINESPDYHDFYTCTNELAHELDTTRQTGGVRCKQQSELLEDVYTFNDFVHAGGSEILRNREQVTGLNTPVPFLITECNGHMYPTKRFDQEARLIEHTKRHLRVINEAIGKDDTAGIIPWCAFDYNTHSSFGSGDKICYHGVCDMFRIPKYAGLAYAAQKPIEEGPVLEILSVVSRGENDGGGIVPILLATNCDAVRVYKNGSLVGDFFPDTKNYPNLSHPPVVINHLLPYNLDLALQDEDAAALKKFIVDKVESGTLVDVTQSDFSFLHELAQKAELSVEQMMGIVIKTAGGWGDNANSLRFEGLRNGQPVIIKEAGELKSFGHISLLPDDDTLCATLDTYDATRIIVRALDTFENLMPFYHAGVTVTTDEKLEVLGPEQFALIGGCTAFWVRTTGKTGDSRIRVQIGDIQRECVITIE